MIENFWHLMLNLTGGIYNFICYIYDIFYFLCGFELFSNNVYGKIVERIYIVLGLIMTFVLAYSLLKAVINPDEFAKGETSFPKLIKNILVSLVIIVILPTVFTIAFSVQNSLLNNNVIPKLILGESSDYAERGDNNNLNIIVGGTAGSVSGGRYIASEMFKAFLYPNKESGICASDNNDCRDKIKNDTSWYDFWTDEKTLEEVDNLILEGESFGNYSIFAKSVKKGNVSFDFIFAVAAGIFVAYVLLNFCFDMALRVVKLAFYQIIAPIPVICRIIPGGKLKDVFSKWTKQIISLFLEVFIRIGALTLGVYLISLVSQNINLNTNSAILNALGQKTLVKALLIMAIIMFIKQIPKLLGDLFGLDTGGMKLGLMDKLAAGGGLIAAAGIGASGLSAVRSFAQSRREGKGFARSLFSGASNGALAGTRAAYGAKGAKNFKDLKNATSKGIADQKKARETVQKYIAKRSNETGGLPFAMFDDFKDWFTGKGVEDLDYVISASGDINKANDAFRGAVKKQWDKHSTDGDIVFNAGDASRLDEHGNQVNFFKGAGNDRMFDLYKGYQYTDENGKIKMRSAADIRNDIEQRKAVMKNRNLDYYIEQEMRNINISAPDKNSFYSSLVDASGNRIFDEAGYNNAVSKYNADIQNARASAEQNARANYQADISDLSLLDSMYSQLEKKSITELGNTALKGEKMGTISAEDLYDARELGETAQRIIRDSSLEHLDPSKKAGEQEVVVENGDFAKFIDDMASAAGKQASHASREKQKYLDKKKNN